MDIKILGVGCDRCNELKRLTREAVKEFALDATITEVKDMPSIMKYRIQFMPGLVINEKVVCSGKVPSKGEITSYITTALLKEENAEQG